MFRSRIRLLPLAIGRGLSIAALVVSITASKAGDGIDHDQDPVDGSWTAKAQPDVAGNCYAYTIRHATDRFHDEYSTSIEWYRDGEQVGSRLLLRWAPSQVAIGQYTPGTANILIPRGDGADFDISLIAHATGKAISNSGEFEMHTKRESKTSGLIAVGDVPAGWLIDQRHANEIDVVIGHRNLIVRRIEMDGYYQTWVDMAHCIGVR